MTRTNPEQRLRAQIDAACADLPLETEAVARAMRTVLSTRPDAVRTVHAPAAAWRAWARTAACSVHAREIMVRHPETCLDLLSGRAAPPAPDPAGASDPASLQAALRRFRQRAMLEIIWHDLNRPDAYGDTVAAVTRLAETCLRVALEGVQDGLQARFGTPRDERGAPVPFTVLGMGKLGGGELNLSSDIDLIFVYGANGSTDGPRSLDNAEYFDRLGRQLIEALSAATEDGFVFRVDMRLRPFGESGPLVVSEEGLEHYYLTHGRDWERYALIKARPVAGDLDFGARLLHTLRPFVYRRYLDFTALAALRELKGLIDAQVRRKDLRDNIKLGPGGIREIEFIVQGLQLIRGGQLPALRERNTLAALDALTRHRILPAGDARVLGEAYRFLRDLEHRLQMAHDAQTHALPADPGERARIAYAMHCPAWDTLEPLIARQRTRVAEHFELAFASPQAEIARQDPAARQAWFLAGSDNGTPEAGSEQMAALGFSDAGNSARILRDFARGHLLRRRLAASGRARLDALMPLVIGVCARFPQPDALLLRFIHLLESVAGRSAYLALLIENPLTLSRLAGLLTASPWFAHQLARHPALLDEVLDLRDDLPESGREALAARLCAELAQEADAEGRMDRLRGFQRTEIFRWARADLSGRADVAAVMRGLSTLAAVLLDAVLGLAWADLTQRHGLPRQADGRTARFCIVALGKLGSEEMSYLSDLDLLFLHDGELAGQSDGPRALANPDFFARLGQRIIYYISTLTPAGTLYSIDMRLRPSGRAGPLVTSLAHLDRYQRHEAWTWEHQALTRARAVAGDATLQNDFEALRRAVLSRPRDTEVLRAEVKGMRARMLDQQRLPRRAVSVKHSPGTLVDIEFLVQYGRLLLAHARPTLLARRDTRGGLFDLAGAALWTADEARELADTLDFYRTLEMRLQLLEQGPLLNEAAAATLETLLPAAFRPLWPQLAARRARVRALWKRYLET